MKIFLTINIYINKVKNMKPKKVLNLLKKGNKRFVKNLSLNRDLLKEARSTKTSQSPIAAVLSCLDSRSSAEVIFDQGIGDVFSARVAGNVVNDDILGSLEFACFLSTAKVIVVLGHTNCGAVHGACDDAKLGHLTNLLEKIKVAVDLVKKPKNPDKRNSGNLEFVDKVTIENVKLTIENIRKNSNILSKMEKYGEIMIVGGIHNLSDGTIKYIK
jgi:carbonic anhydrase